MADISKITLPSGTTYNIKDSTARSNISSLQTKVNNLPDNNTTYTMSNSGSTVTLTDSNGGTQSVVLDSVTGDLLYVQATGSSNTETNLTSTSITQVPLNTISYSSGDFSLQTSGILIPSDGMYRVSASVYMTTSTSSIFSGVYIMRASSKGAFSSASELASNADVGSVSTSRAIAGSTKLVYLNANDVLYLACRSHGGYTGASYFAGNRDTYLRVEKLVGTSINVDDVSSAIGFMGVTTTGLSDGATTLTITMSDGTSKTVSAGSIVVYGNKEFIFDGSTWHEFGDLTGLGSLASKNSASGTFKPSGTVSQPTFTGSEQSVSFSVPSTTVSKASSGTTTYTPEGSNASVSLTPSGTVSQPTFTGTQATISSTISSSTTGTANYTPAGTVSAPTITVTPSTTTNYSITGVGSLPSCTLPSLSMSVSNEALTMSWSAGSFSAGSLPTRSSQTVMTGASASASAPTFTGTGAVLSASATYTPAGSVSKPTFTGTSKSHTHTFTGTGVRLTTASTSTTSKSITPSGTVSQPAFTGTSATVSVS